MKRGKAIIMFFLKRKALWTLLLELLLVTSTLMAMMPMVSAQTEVSGFTEIKLWHILLLISIFFAVLTFSYPLVMRIKRRKERKEGRIEETEKRREEEVMEILREIEELKEKMEREGIKLTSISDVFLVSVQILSEIRVIGYRMEGINGRIEGLKRGVKEEMSDTRTLILFGIATISALSLTIISLL